MIIDLGEAEVENHFRRVNVLTIILSGMYCLFYYTEITIRNAIFTKRSSLFIKDSVFALIHVLWVNEKIKFILEYNFANIKNTPIFRIKSIDGRRICWKRLQTRDTIGEWCWIRGRCELLGETKKFRQNCSTFVSKCAARSNQENEYPHLMVSFTNNGVIGILMRRNMYFSAAVWDRYESYAHKCCAYDSRNYRTAIVRIFTLRPMEVLHGKFMWGIIIYKYYIPERVIVRMFTLRKLLSSEAKPRLRIIFEGWTFLLLPSQECIIYVIIPKLLSGMQIYLTISRFKHIYKRFRFCFDMSKWKDQIYFGIQFRKHKE